MKRRLISALRQLRAEELVFAAMQPLEDEERAYLRHLCVRLPRKSQS